jgi:hypothetical protein
LLIPLFFLLNSRFILNNLNSFLQNNFLNFTNVGLNENYYCYYLQKKISLSNSLFLFFFASNSNGAHLFLFTTFYSLFPISNSLKTKTLFYYPTSLFPSRILLIYPHILYLPHPTLSPISLFSISNNSSPLLIPHFHDPPNYSYTQTTLFFHPLTLNLPYY